MNCKISQSLLFVSYIKNFGMGSILIRRKRPQNMASPVTVQKYETNPGWVWALLPEVISGPWFLLSYCLLFLRSEVEKLYHTVELSGEYAGLYCQVSDSDLHGSWESAFLTTFQAMLMLLVLEPHFGSHCPRVWTLSAWSKLACLHWTHVPTMEEEAKKKCQK